MRIAYLGQKGIPATYGGIERHVEELATRLVHRGHDVTVYCRPYYVNYVRQNKDFFNETRLNLSHTSTEEDNPGTTNPVIERKEELPKEYKGVKLVFLPSIHTKNLDAITHTFLATMHALGQPYDIIHYHGIGPSTLSFIPKLFKPNSKVIVTFHCQDYRHEKWGGFAKFYLRFGEWVTMHIPHGVISVSKVLQGYVQRNYKKKAKYIPNGVPFLKQQSTKHIYQWGLEKNSYLLAVARLVRHKGIHYLVDAYFRLKTDKKLVIVGDTSFTDHYVMALKIAARHNPNIIFTGYQYGDTLAELFSNCYLFVHPSLVEGLPIVVLEAMGYGKCALVSDISENLEAIGEYGFSFKAGKSSDLVKKINHLLKHPRLVQEVGEKAKKWVKENYNWDKISVRTEEFYQGIINHQPVHISPLILLPKTVAKLLLPARNST